MPDLGNLGAIGAWASANGPFALGVMAFVCALGVPLSMPVLLLAFTALSSDVLGRIGAGMLACLVGALLGESLHYGLGATAGSWLRDHTRRRLRQVWLQAERLFGRYPSVALLLSRSVFPAISLPVDWLAGSSGFSYWRFAFWSVLGDSIWILSSAAVGYWLGESWQQYPRVLTVAIIVVIALAFVVGSLVVKRLSRGGQPNEPNDRQRPGQDTDERELGRATAPQPADQQEGNLSQFQLGGNS